MEKYIARSMEWKKTGISNLRVFESIAYVHVPNEKITNLMTKVKHSFPLTIMATSCIIQVMVRLLLAMM